MLTLLVIIFIMFHEVCTMAAKKPKHRVNIPTYDNNATERCISFSILSKNSKQQIPNPFDFNHICDQITHKDISSSIFESQGMKSRYFDNLRKTTKSQLTLKKLSDSNIRITGKANILFIGDSIMREISESYQRISRDSRSLSYKFIELDAWNDVDENNRIGRRRRRLQDGGQRFVGLENSHNKYSKNILGIKQNILTGRGKEKYDIVFVGGLGLHYLLRVQRIKKTNKITSLTGPMNLLNDNLDNPNLKHKLLIQSKLKQLYQLTLELKINIIFVGILPIDSYILNMTPLKIDWIDFYDFSFSDIWNGIEADEVHKIMKLQTIHSSNEFLKYFQPSNLSTACPG